MAQSMPRTECVLFCSRAKGHEHFVATPRLRRNSVTVCDPVHPADFSPGIEELKCPHARNVFVSPALHVDEGISHY